MSKQKQYQQTQDDQKQRTKTQKAISNESEYELVDQIDIGLGQTINHGEAMLNSQVQLLNDPRLLSSQRYALAARISNQQGNAHLQRLTAKDHLALSSDSGSTTVQLEGGRRSRGANPGGRGPGRIQNATEQPYDVSGATLADVGGQLGQFGGYGAQTNAPITMNGRVTPQRQADGTYRARVQWIISGATVQLPRWTGYDPACQAAQSEWDRFMTQTRLHEQQEHVNMARNFVANLGEEDTVITGSSVADIQANLQAKHQELADRLQALHDACDHGVSIDALLHPENGVCE